MGKNFSFCIMSLSTRSWQVDWSHTNEIKHDVIRGIYVHKENDHLEEKIAEVLVPSTRFFNLVRTSFERNESNKVYWFEIRFLSLLYF